MNRNLRAVLFDWDGTLVDTADVTYRCYARLFDGYGIPFSREAYERTYSPNWRLTYEAVGLPRDCWAEADARWIESYSEEESRLLPGARAALEDLRDAGLSLGLVTAGESARVRGELQRHELATFFAVTVYGDETEERKPHPEALLAALGSLAVPAEAAAYVGDSPEDMQMGRAAGTLTIGIPGGFPNRAALVASRPDHLIADLSELAALLA